MYNNKWTTCSTVPELCSFRLKRNKERIETFVYFKSRICNCCGVKLRIDTDVNLMDKFGDH